MKTYVSHEQLFTQALKIGDRLRSPAEDLRRLRCYAIPNGGISALYILMAAVNPIRAMQGLSTIGPADKPEDADFFLDDIIDSGSTRNLYRSKYPGKPFVALIDKKKEIDAIEFPGWIVFPWERDNDGDITSNIQRLLQYVGEDSTREGLLETPARVAKAWKHWTSGYNQNAKDILKVFGDGAESYDQMVTVKDIPIYSHCEHHLAAIFGTCTISYIPDGKIVGLSKLSRLADMFARRLQVQERLTNQIADAMVKHLNPKGVGVHIKARHLCMESRGICQQGHHTITTALRGALLDEGMTRQEFMTLV